MGAVLGQLMRRPEAGHSRKELRTVWRASACYGITGDNGANWQSLRAYLRSKRTSCSDCKYEADSFRHFAVSFGLVGLTRLSTGPRLKHKSSTLLWKVELVTKNEQALWGRPKTVRDGCNPC
jgi:hypothetical protein